MSRLIADSYLYRAIGAEINGACGKCKLSRSDCMGQSLSRMDVCAIIDDAPTVDAVEVVRCKDCKCLRFYEDGTWWCEQTEREIINPDWFCADGEVKNDD